MENVIAVVLLAVVGIVQIIALLTFFQMAGDVKKSKEYLFWLGVHQDAWEKPPSNTWTCPNRQALNLLGKNKCHKCKNPKPAN
jgi:hypothetical protein